MEQNEEQGSAFVIKAEELAALDCLDGTQPQPLLVEWVNLGTDQKMRRSTVEMLLRTLSHEEVSPSIIRLHQSSALRVRFRSDVERDQFSAAFTEACSRLGLRKRDFVVALFDSRADAERVVAELTSHDIPHDSISVIWKAREYRDPDGEQWDGHSKRSVAAAIAGGGIAGAMFGVGILFMPGIGLIAAAGAVAGSAWSSVASVSAIIGATGGALAKMLSDQDVDGREVNYFERQIRQGKVFLSVDTRIAEGQRETARQIIMRSGGQAAICD
jgi:uncharacterized membrane protein